MKVNHKLPKVLVAVPCMEKISTDTAKSLMALIHSGGVQFHSCSVIYEAREAIAKTAIEEGYDYIMWFDSDMIFEPDTLQKLLADKKDVVSGVYFKRVFPYTPVIYEPLENDSKIYEDYPEDKVFEIGACGFGGVLTKVSVLKAVIDEFGGAFYPIGGSVGEDISFCIRARKLGYKIYCDSRVKYKHISTLHIDEDMYVQMRKKVKGEA